MSLKNKIKILEIAQAPPPPPKKGMDSDVFLLQN